jgi:hypothetical protein
MEENTTLMAKPAFVISLKSTNVCLKDIEAVVEFIKRFKNLRKGTLYKTI